MYAKIIFAILFLLNFASVQADEIELKTAFNQYKLQYDNQYLNIKAETYRIEFKKDKCNDKIFESLHSKILKGVNGIVRDVAKSNDCLEFKVDGTTYYAPEKTSTGEFLMTLPGLIRKYKIEESLKCF